MKEFKNFLSHIFECLKIHGFTKEGNYFYIVKHNNFGLINFQKSKNSTSTQTVFTINVATYLTSLRTFNGDNFKKRPDIERSHWKKRIGFMLPERKDKWWTIDANTNLKQLIAEISSIVNDIAVPEMLNHIKDTDLKTEWLDGISSGITEFQRYIFLTSLLKTLDDENLLVYVERLRQFSKGKPIEEAAQEHIKALAG